ncbi:MAG: WXG100 family type VII secretion target [Chloroflexi bacterium CFX4]|nr:WXG100 family type VII secretion target [Chloroflexi bacterium CFX4]MDL1923821.1 WXG100 family type VII secretion target [Chloroflexi bacterium CFX3]
MSASKIQCHYADLNNAAQQFTRQSEGTQQLLRTVQNCLQQLQGGAWRGKGANTFYAELEREVLPGVQRLISALREASSATQRIGQTLEQAEREAGALFVGGDADADGRGGGEGEVSQQGENNAGPTDQERKDAIIADLATYGITLTGTWSLADLQKLQSAVHATANRLTSFAANHYEDFEFKYTPQTVFKRLFGNLTFERGVGADRNGEEEGGAWAWYSSNTITLWNSALNGVLKTFAGQSSTNSSRFLIMHELGHDLENMPILVRNPETGLYERTTVLEYFTSSSEDNANLGNGTAGYTYRARSQLNWEEYMADGVANWLYGTFDDSDAGRARREQMDTLMRGLIYAEFGIPISEQPRPEPVPPTTGNGTGGNHGTGRFTPEME